MIYQVYPRSWADSDGDGVGDLRGIATRLPYLRDLGVDAVWLSPFYPSPQADARLRRDRLSRRRPPVRHAGRRRHAAGHRARPRHQGHRGPRPEPQLRPARVVPGRAGRRARAAPSAERYLFRDGRGPAGDLPPNNWKSVFGGSAWTRVRSQDDTNATPGWPVVPAPVRPRTTRLQLGQPAGPRRVRGRAQVLARPGCRRLPGRRRPWPGQGVGAARLGRAPAPARRRRWRPARAPQPASADVGPKGRARDLSGMAANPQLLQPDRC